MVTETYNAEMLSRLVVMQAMMPHFKDPSKLLSFVCRGLLDFPGIKGADCDFGHEESSAHAGFEITEIASSGKTYGRLVLDIADRLEFEPYAPYIRNLATMIGVLLENRELNGNLEELVSVRTSELAEIFELSPNLICVADINDATFLKVNPAFTNILGYEEEELINHQFSEFIHPNDIEPTDIITKKQLQRGDDVVGFRNRYRHKDGSWRWLEWQAHPLPERGITFSVAHDITDQKKAEKREKEVQEAIARAKRMESIGILAGGVAHDLNNSLSPLVFLPEMILEDLHELDVESKDSLTSIEESLDLINESARRSAEVVKGLLHLSMRGQYNLQPMDLNTAICVAQECDRCSHKLRTLSPDITITNSVADKPLMIMADRSHLDRAISNIVRNATESIEGKGTVSICTSTQRIAEPINGLEIVPPGRYAVLEIKDTGQGISEEQLDHIFEPFYSRKVQSKQSGSGLGLSIVHGIVKDHSGFIDVASTVMKGTTFTLYFPLIDESAKLEEDARPEAVPRGTERILIVDDEKSLRVTLKMGLQRFGYDATAVRNGRQAVALFAEAAKAKKDSPFDLVVLDMTMEVDFDGLDTYQGILKLYPGQKVMIASGHADGERLQTAIDLGADFIPKPFDREDLARAARKRLDKIS